MWRLWSFSGAHGRLHGPHSRTAGWGSSTKKTLGSGGWGALFRAVEEERKSRPGQSPEGPFGPLHLRYLQDENLRHLQGVWMWAFLSRDSTGSPAAGPGLRPLRAIAFHPPGSSPIFTPLLSQVGRAARRVKTTERGCRFDSSSPDTAWALLRDQGLETHATAQASGMEEKRWHRRLPLPPTQPPSHQ